MELDLTRGSVLKNVVRFSLPYLLSYFLQTLYGMADLFIIGQYAGVEALKNGDEDVAQMREEYNGRRRYLLHRFKEMGLSCFEPFGAFYVFPCISEFGMTSEQFATELLNTEKLAVVPGTAFGDCGEGFIRISYAYSLENLKEAMNRMEAFITDLRKRS